MTEEAEDILDLRGLRCPLPVLRVEAALRRMAPGAVLLAAADDPVAAVDIPHFAAEGGHRAERMAALESAYGAGVCVFQVTRGENSR